VSRRSALAAVALALVALLAPQPAQAAFDVGAEFERAYWGQTPSEVSPGDGGRLLTVEIRNGDTIGFYGVEAELRDHANLTPSLAGGDEINRGETFAAGDVWKAQFRVDLDDNLTVGDELGLDVRVTMRANEDGSGFDEGDILRETLDVTVTIPGRTDLSAEATTPSVPRDTRTTVPIAITNDGDGAAGTIEINASPGPGSGLRVASAGSVERIPRLGPGETSTVDLTVVTPAETGLQDLRVGLTYASTVGEPVRRSLTVPLNVAYRSIEPVSVDLVGEATAGRASEVTLRVTNDGQEALGDLEARVQPQAPPQGPSQLTTLNGTGVVALGPLESGQTTSADVRVYASRQAPDLVPVDVTLQWRDDSGFDRRLERTFGLVVQGAIEVQMTGLDARLHGDEREIVVEGRITNTGNTEATNVYLRIEPAEGLEGTDPVYQGDLDPDSPIPFTLASPADPEDAPDSVTLTLTWTDDQGQSRELTRGVGVRPASPPAEPADEAEDNDTPAPGVAAVLVAVALGLALRRREV
jgi:hypothetical protein